MSWKARSLTAIEEAVRRAVVDDRVGIFSGWDPAEHLEGLQIEHDHRLVVPRGGEPMPRGFRRRGSVRALDAGDFAEQRSMSSLTTITRFSRAIKRR